MPRDDSLRQVLAQSSPWLTLHDLKQEVQELRAMIEAMSSGRPETSPPDRQAAMPELQIRMILERLQAIEQRAAGLQTWGHLFNIRATPQTVLLADAQRVARLNEDERIAGILLALCTLFVGALLQTLIDSQGALVITVAAAACFGGLALLYYRRSHDHWQQLNAEGQFTLWPSPDVTMNPPVSE